jgi:hypothetical protein
VEIVTILLGAGAAALVSATWSVLRAFLEKRAATELTIEVGNRKIRIKIDATEKEVLEQITESLLERSNGKTSAEAKQDA